MPALKWTRAEYSASWVADEFEIAAQHHYDGPRGGRSITFTLRRNDVLIEDVIPTLTQAKRLAEEVLA